MSTDQRRAQVLAEMEKIDRQWAAIALYLLEHHPQDVMMFVFMSIDTVQHYFWQYMDRSHFLHDPKAEPRFGNAVRQVYERLDAVTGQIIEKLPADTTVLVVSDHGGGPVVDRTRVPKPLPAPTRPPALLRERNRPPTGKIRPAQDWHKHPARRIFVSA